MTERFDAIIVGTGQAAKPLAGALAKAGKKTASIESKHVGGTCVNEGCTPTKTMIASGRVAYLARRSADYGVHTGAIRIDLEKVRERKRSIVDSFRNGGQERLEKTPNLELIFGEAQFAGATTRQKTVEVRTKDGGTRFLSAKLVFIDAGTRAARPKIDGLDDVPTLDNASIMELDAVPEHLLVLGGGYIGLEFGQLFRRFGSRVTIVQRGHQLLVGEDSDVADEVAAILRQDGIEILLNATAVRAGKSGASIQMDVEHMGNMATLTGSHLLIA